MIGTIHQVVVPHLVGSYVGRTKAGFCDSPSLQKATHLLGTLTALLESTYLGTLPVSLESIFLLGTLPASQSKIFTKHITCSARSDSFTRHVACFLEATHILGLLITAIFHGFACQKIVLDSPTRQDS